MGTTIKRTVIQWLELLIPEVRDELIAHAIKQDVKDLMTTNLADAIDRINWRKSELTGALVNPLPVSIMAIYYSINNMSEKSPYYYTNKSIKSVVYDED